ncbi:MAG: YncE family protein [Actinomycetota bacterium]|nr:YncE family protein [Actinomycetota bacterium]
MEVFLRSALTGPLLALAAALLAACQVEAPMGSTRPPAETAATPGSGGVPTSAPTGAAQPASPTPVPKPVRQVWVAVEKAGQVVLVDLDRQEVIARHRTGGGPHNLTVAPGGTVAAALYGSDALAIIRDGRSLTVRLGGRPHDVKAAGDRFVVTNEEARRIDLVSLEGRQVGSIPLRAQPHDLDVTPDGSTAWVTLNGTDELALIDLAAGQVIRYHATGQQPHDIRVGADGRLWVTDWRGPLHVLSGEGQLQASLSLGREAHHLAFTPDGAQLWLVDHAIRQAYIVDTATVQPTGQIELPGAPHHVAVTGDGSLAAIADHTNGTVVVYDVASRRLVATIEVGPEPHGLWAPASAPQ